MLSYGQAGKAILIASCLVIVCSFSYYYASSAFATMNTGAALAANVTASSSSSLDEDNLDSDDSCGICGPAKIAIIDPTFTAAAYDDSFYNFFRKYASASAGEIIKDDTSLLSNVVPSKSRQQFAVETLAKHLKSSANSYNVTILGDADVHEGLIFSSSSKDGNAYDILVLFHNEYVTQEEYQNIKAFVANGGTLFVMDGNVLYAEVKYDKSASTVTLVKGHGWAFDGESAQRSISERWANETTEWLGSNYLCFSCKITFGNNPFRYSHHEEQYITNPGVTVIKDYNATALDYKSVSNPKIATYEMNYAKGKVIVMGLYSSDIINNSEFLAFVDGLLPS